MVDRIETIVQRRSRSVHRMIITFVLYDCSSMRKLQAICWCFAREDRVMDRLRSITIIERFGSDLEIPLPVVRTWVLFHYNSCSICTSFLASVATHRDVSDHGSIFVFLATRIRRKSRSSVAVVMSCAWPYLFFCFFSHIIDVEYWCRLGILGAMFSSGGNMTFIKPSTHLLLKRTGSAKLHKMPKSTLTFKSPIRTRSDIVPTTLTFCLLAFSNDVRLFACIAFSNSAIGNISLMRLTSASVSKKRFAGGIFLAIWPTEIDTLKFLSLN